MDIPAARRAGERRSRCLLSESGGVAGGALLGSPGVSSQLGCLAAELRFARWPTISVRRGGLSCPLSWLYAAPGEIAHEADPFDPNRVPRFYRCGPAIDELCGMALEAGDKVVRADWIGSTTTAFGLATGGLTPRRRPLAGVAVGASPGSATSRPRRVRSPRRDDRPWRERSPG